MPDASFCHDCGFSIDGVAPRVGAGTVSPWLRWGIPGAAVIALLLLSLRTDNRAAEPPSSRAAPGPGSASPPDISSMSPGERADRLFNRVMQLWSEGKADSATFFAPMAVAAFEAVSPMTAHTRYDLGLVALVAGEVERASAQSDTILATRSNHLLGLALAARVADTRGDSVGAHAARRRLVAAEKAELAAGLPEYRDHEADLRAMIDSARSR